MASSDLGAYSQSDIQDIANAIRFKNGSDQLYKVSEMAQAITDIQAGGYYDAHPYRDGKTHMWIDVAPEARSITLALQIKRRYISPEWFSTGTIYWGDGENTKIISNRDNDEYQSQGFSHTYATGGEYVVTIEDDSSDYHEYNKLRANGNLFIYDEDSRCVLKAIEVNHNQGNGSSGGVGENSLFGYDKSLENVMFGPGCTELGRKLFDGSYNLKNVDFSHANENLEINNYYMFNQCHSLKQVDLSNISNWTNHLATIKDNYMFDMCYCLESVILPNAVYFNTLRQNDFKDTYNIRTITIPESVTTIEKNAFNSCRFLHSIYMASSIPPTLADTLGNNIPSNFKIYVPTGSISEYQSTSYWSTYSSKFVEYTPE